MRTISKFARGLSTAARATSEHTFDVDSAVRRIAAGHYQGVVPDKWSVGDAPNGGLLAVMALNTAKDVTKFEDPLSVSVHFANKALENKPIDFFVESLNAARSTEMLHVVAKQEGRTRFACLATFGALSNNNNNNNQDGFSKMTSTAPDLPPLEECIDAAAIVRAAWGKRLAISHNWELRVAERSPIARGIFRNQTGTEAVLEGWIAFTEPKKTSSFSTVFLLDAFPPPVLNVVSPSEMRHGVWVPTVEYTVHNWTKPAELEGEGEMQWLRARFHSHKIHNGMLTTDGELWSRDGSALLAESRQSARLVIQRAP